MIKLNRFIESSPRRVQNVNTTVDPLKERLKVSAHNTDSTQSRAMKCGCHILRRKVNCKKI